MPTTTRGYVYPASGDPVNVPGDLLNLANSVQSDVTNNVSARYLTLNSQTGTTYTAVLADAQERLILFNNAAAITFTLPANATTAFPIGSVINYSQVGAGRITASPAAGVTIRSYLNQYRTAGQYASAALIKVATDEWYLSGQVIV